MRPRYADLIRRLGDPDPRQVDRAFDALLFDREQAVPALAEALAQRRRPARVRLLLVQLLGFSGSPEAVPPLRAALSDPSPELRAEACLALADLGLPGLESLLRPRLADLHPRVREAAAEALELLAPRREAAQGHSTR